MKRFATILAVILTLGLAGTASAAHTIKLAHWAAPTHPVTMSVDYFKEGLEKESNGAFKVQHFPNNQLGSEDTFINQVQRGTVQMAISGTLIKKDEPNVGLIDMPFVISSWEQGRAVYLEDPRGREIISGKYTQKTGVRIDGFVINGFRVVSSKTPLESMDDLSKVKLRVPGNEIYVKLFQALGVNTVMMPMTEIYNALETKVVDGQENPYATIKGAGFWEVQGGILETRHIFSTSPVLVNGKFHSKLSESEKALLDKWIANLVRHNWELSEKIDNESKMFMEGKGVKIVVPSVEFHQQMLDSLTGFYAWFETQLPASKEWMEYCKSKQK